MIENFVFLANFYCRDCSLCLNMGVLSTISTVRRAWIKWNKLALSWSSLPDAELANVCEKACGSGSGSAPQVSCGHKSCGTRMPSQICVRISISLKCKGAAGVKIAQCESSREYSGHVSLQQNIVGMTTHCRECEEVSMCLCWWAVIWASNSIKG